MWCSCSASLHLGVFPSVSFLFIVRFVFVSLDLFPVVRLLLVRAVSLSVSLPFTFRFQLLLVSFVSLVVTCILLPCFVYASSQLLFVSLRFFSFRFCYFWCMFAYGSRSFVSFRMLLLLGLFRVVFRVCLAFVPS